MEEKMNKLPIWNGWTIDVRLRQFRKVDGGLLDFVHFDSEEGKEIFKDYCQSRHDELCDEAGDYLQVVFQIDENDFNEEDADVIAKEMGTKS